MPIPATGADKSPTEGFRTRIDRLLARTVRTRMIRSAATAPIVSFTFDDTPASAATTGAALLESFGARGTFYVAGGLLGAIEPTRRLATGEQCLALHRRGHDIGCHTFAHHAVATYGREALAADLARNEALLAELGIGGRPRNFAYPFNATNLRAKRQLERHFASCRGGVPGVNVGAIDLGFLRAVELCDDTIDGERVRGWIAEATRLGGWLVFFTHGVTPERQPWCCSPLLLEGALREAHESGCAIVTVEQALDRIGARPPADRNRP